MSLRDLSSWISSSPARKHTKVRPAARSIGRQAGRRRLCIERLEDRQLLSIGAAVTVLPSLASPSAAAALTATAHAPAAGISVLTATDPTISQVKVSQSQGQITWNVADSAGVQSSSITLDGTTVTKIYGPFPAPSGVNYSAVYGSVPAGAHTYVITATDNDNNTSQYTGTFTAGPVIGKVVVSHAVVNAQTQGVISWNIVDSTAAVQSSTVTIDGSLATNIYGPGITASGVNYSAVFGPLPAGSHTAVITATDAAGLTSQYTQTFTLNGPTISKVVISHAMVDSVPQGEISWNVADAAGVTASSVSIDGNVVTKLYGPFTAPSGANFAAVYGALPAGTHSCVITAVGGEAGVSYYSQSFTVSGPTISGVVFSQALVGTQKQGQVTWNVADAAGVVFSSLSIDGAVASQIFGPFTAASGVNYAALLGTLGAGRTRTRSRLPVATAARRSTGARSRSPGRGSATWRFRRPKACSPGTSPTPSASRFAPSRSTAAP